MKPTLLFTALLAASHADPIHSGTFKADLDPAFPALRSLTYQGNRITLPSTDPLLRINGQDTSATCVFTTTSKSEAAYRLTAPAIGVALTVKSGISTPPKTDGKLVLFEDFENVDEAWGPFMYGWKGPMNTHFSEANPPHTNDTIGGEFSLKSRKENAPDIVYRSVPATLQFQPNTKYRVSFDYLCDNPGFFTLVAGTDQEDGKPTVLATLDDASWAVKKITATFTTDDRSDWFIGLSKVDKEKRGTFTIDNILVEKVD